MHHKRKRPKNRRGGCLMCKANKMNHARHEWRNKPGINRKLQDKIADLHDS